MSIVIEVIRQNRQARRLRGKSDPIDAHQAARVVLTGADTIPKTADGHVESLRILISERRPRRPRPRTARHARAGPDLEQRATLALAQLTGPEAA